MGKSARKFITDFITDEKCRILQNQQLVPEIYRLRFESTFIARHAIPGQFLNLRVIRSLTPLLRRPFCIHRIQAEAQWVEILFDVRGIGTQILAEASAGTLIDVLGPLGMPFQWDSKLQVALLVGGGMGIAPLLFLAQRLQPLNVPIICYYGVRSHQQLCCQDDLKELGVTLKIATEDGKTGFHGLITDLLKADHQSGAFQETTLTIFACGPAAMLRTVQTLAEKWQVEAQLSLESMMGCGFGVCVGCAIPTRNPENATNHYKLVCQDGPVFSSKEVIIPD